MTDRSSPKSPLRNFAVDLFSGFISGVVSKTLVAPIGRVQVVLQTQDANPRIVSGTITRYTGIWNVMTRISAEQGLRGFWTGNAAHCLIWVPNQASALILNDSLKEYFSKHCMAHKYPITFANMLSAGLASFASAFLSYPLMYSYIRLAAKVEASNPDFAGIWDSFRGSVRGPRGLRELYSGFGVHLCGMPLHRVVSMTCFDQLRWFNPYKNDKGALGLMSTFFVGSVSNISSLAVTYPVQTVSRRLAMQGGRAKEERLYQGAVDCIGRVARQEGIRGFYRGFSVQLLSSVCAPIMLITYDRLKVYLL